MWLSRLHSDTRTEQTEAAFREWLAASPLNRAAFERMTLALESSASLRRVPVREPSQRREFGWALRRVLVASAAALALCALLTVAAFYVIHLKAAAKAETITVAAIHLTKLVLPAHRILCRQSAVSQ